MSDELLVLGSASGLPTQRRFTSAYLLSAAGKLFLLDCGAPVGTLLTQYGYDPIDVRAVFISHWHMDHVAGLGLFLSQNHLRKRPGPLTLYGPRGTKGKVRRLLKDSFLMGDQLSYELKVVSIKPKKKKKYKEALLRITYFKTQHLERSKYKTNFGRKALACGIVINGPGWRLVYSGDLRSSQELAPHVGGCDLLIHEMAHVRPKEVAEFATTAKVPRLLVSHIGPEFDEAPRKIVEAFDGLYQGELVVAEDGTRVSLGQPVDNS